MIDMTSPGVEVRPILLINGTSPFCETFFTDVKVPKENQWGPLNGGWTVGKRLLQFERDNDLRRPGRRQHRRGRPRRWASRATPRSTSASTRPAGWPTPTCAAG